MCGVFVEVSIECGDFSYKRGGLLEQSFENDWFCLSIDGE